MMSRARWKKSAGAAAILCCLGVVVGCAGPAPGEDAPASAGARGRAPALEVAAIEPPDMNGELEAGEVLFLDGDRRVRAVRVGPPSSSAALSPVILRYGGGRPEVPALIGKGAIVEIGAAEVEDEDARRALFAELGVRPVRPLMPSAGLWLVEDEGAGDGLDVASRLSVQLPSNSAESSHRSLRGASPDLYLRHRLYGDPYTPNDTRFPGQWYFESLRMSEAWSYTKGDASNTIVVVDTGCDMNHPDLVQKMDQGRDVIDGDDDPSFIPGMDGAAHGTECAGLVGASTDNAEGIAGGCPECRIRCVRLLNDMPTPTSVDVDAFNFAFDTGAAVVSNSWGFSDPIPVPKALATAINKVFDSGRGGLGALVIFAAGNDNMEVKDDELLAVRGVLGIGAINHIDEETAFTNFGNSVDLVAPTGTLTTDISGSAGDDPGSYTGSFGGTSSACPVAAGIAGLLVSAAPEKTAAELYEVLIKTARPAPFAFPDANGHDPLFGYGIIDPVPALKNVLGIKDPPDAGPPDAGSTEDPVEPEPTGCGCALPGLSRGPGPGSIAFTIGGLGYFVYLARRPRRRRASA